MIPDPQNGCRPERLVGKPPWHCLIGNVLSVGASQIPPPLPFRDSIQQCDLRGADDAGTAWLLDLDDRYERPSAVGDPLEKPNSIIPWPVFEKPLGKPLKRSDGSKGGWPAFPSILIFKILVLQALYNLSDGQAEFVIQDRLSFERFLGLFLSAKRYQQGEGKDWDGQYRL